jgi:ABC-2 type transport system ATP-binding protein
MSYIKVENITKRFDDKLVLDNISFEINEGDFFGLIGPNGAGKSTLINIMTGLLPSNGGNFFVGEYSIKKNPLKVKEQIGLVPQNIALITNATAYDNLEFFGSLYGLKGKNLKDKINQALEVTGLMDKKKERVKKFSGGMMRRLNIAAAIMHNPKILILDEPTVGIDPQSRNHIFEFTKKINKENKTTVIYTSHYMEEIELLCNNLFILDLGKEIAYGSKHYVKSLMTGNNKVTLKLDNLKGNLLLSFKKLPGVKECFEEDGFIKLIIEEASFKLETLLKIIEVNDSKIKSINFEEPSLEEVFLALTGKKLRD